MSDAITDAAPDTAAMQAELDKFRAHGLTPEQLDLMIPDYVELVNKSKAAPAPRAEKVAPEKAPEKPAADDKITAELLKRFPGLQNLDAMDAKVKQLEAHMDEGAKDAFRDANIRADEHVTEYLTKQFNVDPSTPEGKKFIDAVSEMVGDATYSRDAYLQRLARGDSRVVKEVLKEFKDKGLFDHMKIPTRPEPKVLPYQSPRNSPFKDTAAKIQEHLKTLKPHERLRAIGSQVFDQVIHAREE